jgi:hypothetical protein
MRNDEVMVKGEWGERVDRRDDMLLLDVSDWGLASFQERITT